MNNETHVTQLKGADNAPWYACVTKIGHPNASVTIMKYETTVFIFHTTNLSKKNFRVRVCSHYRTLEEAISGFYAAVGKASQLEWRDHLFMVMDDNPRSELKHRMKFDIPFMESSDKYLEDRRDYNRLTADGSVLQVLVSFTKNCMDEYIKRYEPDRLRDSRPKLNFDN